MVYNVNTHLQENLNFWHFTLCIFQFPQDWPSHIFALAVFPQQVPIPVEWLQAKNIEEAYHPLCHVKCEYPPPGSARDPAVWTYYHGICPKNYPYGLYHSAQYILVADLDDLELLQWLHNDSNLALFSFLSDLEYLVYDEFHTFLHFPIVMFHFKRYSKSYNAAIDLRVKVFGMGHGVMPITTTTTLVDISNISIDSEVTTTWRQQLFFSIRSVLKHDYFDKFLTVHTILESFRTTDEYHPFQGLLRHSVMDPLLAK